MTRPFRIGMLTPSSNTVLEPVTARLLAGLPGATAHYSRFKVTTISLDDAGLQQFDSTPMLDASLLLADARVDVIGWNGTSSSWLGFDRDRELVASIEAETGIAALTCVLSYLDALAMLGAKSIGLVTPYTQDVQARIIANFETAGIATAAESHFDLSDNFAFALVPGETIGAALRDVAGAAPDAIVVLCTNLDGATGAAALESALGIPVLDSVVVTLWGALRRGGCSTAALSPFGPRLSRL